jgi:hypothetical protein
MGYYTKYELDYKLPNKTEEPVGEDFIKACKENKVEIPKYLQNVINDVPTLQESVDKYISDKLEDYFEDECKWYEHNEDMGKMSLSFPDVLFTLTGDGEESEDSWVAFYKNGKVQEERAKVTYGDFDPKKLKKIS